MRTFKNVAKKMLFNEEGAALVEYAMLVGLIAIVCITAVTNLGTKIKEVFETIVTRLVIPAAGGQ